MLPKLLKVLKPEDCSIHIRHETSKYFSNPWHFHPELELTLVLQSTGTRFVGDSMEHFTTNDLILLGSNLPHYWKNDPEYYHAESKLTAEAIVIRFKENFLGLDQFSAPELAAIKVLYDKAKRGLKIQGHFKQKIIKSIKKLLNSEGLERMILFLSILNLISKSNDLLQLSSEGYTPTLNPKIEKRMNDVYHFITNNFRNDIGLKEIAEIANMNPSAFSRYFAESSGKPVSRFIQDMRIGYACKLLAQTNKSISEIIYEAGFNNQAHFNKIFHERLGVAPNTYRRTMN